MAEETSRVIRETIIIDRAVFDLDTVKKAAYRFIDRFAVDFRQTDSEIICDITFTNSAAVEVQILISDFKKEILDQDLRRKVSSETAALRNAILALAFSSSSVSKRE